MQDFDTICLKNVYFKEKNMQKNIFTFLLIIRAYYYMYVSNLDIYS